MFCLVEGPCVKINFYHLYYFSSYWRLVFHWITTTIFHTENLGQGRMPVHKYWIGWLLGSSAKYNEAAISNELCALLSMLLSKTTNYDPQIPSFRTNCLSERSTTSDVPRWLINLTRVTLSLDAEKPCEKAESTVCTLPESLSQACTRFTGD